jgi:hypothetical protein
MSKKDALALRRLLAAGLSFFAIPASAALSVSSDFENGSARVLACSCPSAVRAAKTRRFRDHIKSLAAVVENRFDRDFKQARYFKSERQARIVLLHFD